MKTAVKMKSNGVIKINRNYEYKSQEKSSVEEAAGKMLKRKYDGCEVALIFKEHNPKVKDKVLWLLLEDYQARISEELKSTG